MKLNKKTVIGIGGGALLVAVVALISVSSAKRNEAAKHEAETKLAQQSAPRPVRFVLVKREPVEHRYSYPGIVKASEESALSFRVGGPLTQVTVNLGAPVQKGDLLMQVDPRDFEDRIMTLEAQLAGAVAMQQNAAQDYQRISELFEEKVVPQSDYDHAKNARNSADASVKTLNAQLQIARHALKDAALLAPYDGTVTEQLVENHEMISPGQVVLRYHNIQLLEIVVNVPENEAANALADTEFITADASFPAMQGKVFEARLKEWSTQADPLTRTYAATFGMPAPSERRILPGMTANVSWVAGAARASALTVPVSALVSDANGGSAVWVYDEQSGASARRPVKVGALAGASRMVVLSGLAEGEKVVVSGPGLIYENLSLKTASIR
ncbi:efflux RND transporter periplasmic adaptor subunit [Pontiella sulfatireligans]|uniref:Solvent efflux pump periplasmic linker SrpA n=1 Tax=Pontiella sulfatireligans TaxID=2750658 RepID=A0A6C2ULI0_9BACT|nr:efflux RND transporter periplasmic adaptor subunit [Pontiella sulfatireligans]VGO20277.1 Solvent efflux pump periplasmic linker SrpA [Pontiella sulfatireligans]